MLGHAKALAMAFYFGLFVLFGCVVPWIMTGIYIFKSFTDKCI